MNYLKSIVIVMSMYTKIPMPKVEFNNASLKHCMCFLPLVGLIVGGVEVAWLMLSVMLGFSPVFFAAAACSLPLLITGGIHMDGFSDTSDALNSHASIEKKHVILSDPHVGSFSVMFSAAYILMLFAAFHEIYSMIGGLNGMWILAAEETAKSEKMEIRDFALSLLLVFVSSRALTALTAANIKISQKKGMLYTFIIFSNKKALTIVSLAFLIICSASAVLLFGLPGISFPAAFVIVYLYFIYMALRQFGGLSGDLCGWLIQVTELILMIILVFMLR